MAIDDNFDYKNFALNMVSQADEFRPLDITQDDFEYIKKTMKNFIELSAEALDDGSSISLTEEEIN